MKNTYTPKMKWPQKLSRNPQSEYEHFWFSFFINSQISKDSNIMWKIH